VSRKRREEGNMTNDRRETDQVHHSISLLTRILNVVDTVILVLVAFGIIGIAGSLLYEAITDALFFWSSHSIPHIISELMFTLIIMELFRQVLRQINKKPFSLNPFLFIGFIASIRGILLTQMSLSLGDVEWREGHYFGYRPRRRSPDSRYLLYGICQGSDKKEGRKYPGTLLKKFKMENRTCPLPSL
jgi:uncharacterized membrane protein (DUF373 family)